MKNALMLASLMFPLFLSDALPKDGMVSPAPLPVTVGYVSDANAVDGCGCYFYWPGEESKPGARTIFSSDFENAVWMNLNGKDVRLKRMKSTESAQNSKKGGRYYEIYRAEAMTVRIDYHVTWTCEADMPESESCEVTRYDLKITFTQNGQQKTINAKGDCGC